VRSIFVLALLVLGPGCGSSPTSPASPAGAGRFAVTVSGAGVTIGGILFRPAIASGNVRPVIVVLHPALPQGTNGADYVAPLARRYSELGYIAFAMSMRGWPPSGGADDCGLLQVDDIVRVVTWLRGEPGVDPAHIGLLGFSKGAQNALLAAARGASVQAVVAYAPPTDLLRWDETTDRTDLPDYIRLVCQAGEGLTPRTPVAQAARITAPVLLVHGDADTRVPLEQSQLMAEALRAAGRDVELLVVAGADHGLTTAETAMAQPIVDAFLASRLALRRTP
jgi:dipeptidyl aminopeptidase/acylaminoacyl peptidase